MRDLFVQARIRRDAHITAVIGDGTQSLIGQVDKDTLRVVFIAAKSMKCSRIKRRSFERP